MQYIIILLGAAFLFLRYNPAAGAEEQKQQTTQQQAKAVNVGNTVCPVTGEKIDQNSKATYEYKGKIYNFCCSGCIGEFKKDPEKYIKKLEDTQKK